MNGFSCISFFFVYFVGKDAGELYIKCECLERILLSKTYATIDATFKDVGTSSDYNQSSSAWAFVNCTDSIRTRDENGTLFDITNAGLSTYARIIPNTTSQYANYLSNDTVVEMDIINVDTSGLLSFGGYSRASGTLYHSLRLDTVGKTSFHIKVIFTSTKAEYYVDNELVSSRTFSDASEHRLYFQLEQGKYVKIKNFCIYPI